MDRVSGLILVLLGIASLCPGLAPRGPWDKFNLAPPTRVSRPKSIYASRGNVQDQQNLSSSANGSGITTLLGNGSFIVLDFGQEVRPQLRVAFEAQLDRLEVASS